MVKLVLKMIGELLNFIKNPAYKVDENKNLKYRFRVFLRLLFIAISISLVLGLVIGSLESVVKIDLGKHAMDLLVEQYSVYFIVLAAVVLAPVLEELLFRGPLVFFKKSRYFKIVFYLFTAIFAFYHITNFELNATILWLSPILVAPQLSVGLLLGFIRVRFGLLWAMLLHASYNLILVGPLILFKFLDQPVV